MQVTRNRLAPPRGTRKASICTGWPEGGVAAALGLDADRISVTATGVLAALEGVRQGYREGINPGSLLGPPKCGIWTGGRSRGSKRGVNPGSLPGPPMLGMWT